MKLCILGGGLTGLSLAKSLVKKGLSIDIFLNKKKSDFNRSRTIGISNDNLMFFNKEILDIEKLFWNIKKIEIYSDNLRNEKILNFENNNKSTRPEYPFIRSILIKLEECLVLKKNTLLNLAVKERKILKKKGKDFMFRKFDLINTWQGSLLYFFILVLTIFILKRYFILNVNIIEIQNIENQIIDK